MDRRLRTFDGATDNLRDRPLVSIERLALFLWTILFRRNAEFRPEESAISSIVTKPTWVCSYDVASLRGKTRCLPAWGQCRSRPRGGGVGGRWRQVRSSARSPAKPPRPKGERGGKGRSEPFEWRTAAPESEGLSTPKLEALWAGLRSKNTDILVIIRNDQIVFETVR